MPLQQDMPHTAFYYDPESRNWGFRVPSLHIVGGGCQTRAEAERHARSAIAFTVAPKRQEAGRRTGVRANPTGTGADDRKDSRRNKPYMFR